ncbi:MAG: hypothetical protein MUP33_08855, partial [Polaromonas sp.]|nr:hypothetical protein [Polaromonas sp.]
MANQAREHDRVFHAKFAAARQARALRVRVRPHRSITALTLTPYLLAQAVILPLVLCALLFWGKPQLLEFWRSCILYWSELLNLSFSVTNQMIVAGDHISRLT